jgi:hypothetical protein
MKKPILNEEIARLRKIMGLNESEEVDLSKVDNPNAYTDDIFNYNSERGGEGMDDFSFEKSAIESASGEEVVQREFDDYDRPLFYSVKDDNIHYFIGDFGNGEVIVKYNAKTGERYPIGDLKDYDSPMRAKDSDEGIYETEKESLGEGTWEVDPAYTHFAVNKNDNKIYNGWEYDADTDKESIMHYCKMDLNDMDLNPKDFKVNSKKFLLSKGIDPFNSDNWKNTRMDEGNPEEKMVSFDDLLAQDTDGMSQEDQAMIDAHDEEEANKYASKNYDDVESGAIDEDWGSSDQGYMNKSIHDSLNQPTEFSFGMYDDLKNAAEEAVDHFWDDWEEYNTDREGLVMKAMKLYLRRYFPDWYENVSKMFS